MSRHENVSRRGLPPSPGVSVQADKRFRRSDVRPDRKRAVGRALLRSLRWVLPLIALAVVSTWVGGRLLHSSFFRVQHLIVEGNNRLSIDDVEALLDGVRHRNILDVDLDRARLQMMDSPWVRDVTLWRVLPSTIGIRVHERVPMAIARAGQSLYLVDDAGLIIDEYDQMYRDLDLPIVDGLLTAAKGGASPADPERVRLTSQLLAAVASRADLREHVSQVDVSNAQNVSIMLDEEPTWLRLGDERFVERISAYVELRSTLAREFQDVDYVDLRFEEHVFVHSRARTMVKPAAARRPE